MLLHLWPAARQNPPDVGGSPGPYSRISAQPERVSRTHRVRVVIAATHTGRVYTATEHHIAVHRTDAGTVRAGQRIDVRGDVTRSGRVAAKQTITRRVSGSHHDPTEDALLLSID